jgi:hypothetical protein
MAKTRAQERKKRVMADADAAMGDAPLAGGVKYLKLPKDLRTFTPAEGAYNLEAIPYQLTKASMRFLKNSGKEGQFVPRRVLHVHYDVGPERDTVVCPAKNFGKPCPICEKRSEIAQGPHDYKKDLKPLQTKERVIRLLFDRAKPERGVQFKEWSYWKNFEERLDEKITGASEKRQAKYKKYWDPDEGLTLRVVFKKEKMDETQSYLAGSVNEFEEREDPVPEQILDHGYTLDDYVIVKSYEDIKRQFFQVPDAPPKGGKGNKPSRNGTAAAAADDEDEDSEAGGGDEGEEEEEESAEEEVEFSKGDEVEWDYKNKVRTGTVKSVNRAKGLAAVDGEDGKLYSVEVEDLRPAATDEDEDEDAEEEEDEEALVDDGDEDEESEDEDEDEDSDEDEEEEDGDEDEDEEEMAPSPPPRRKPKRPAAKKTTGGRR